jgi:CheY-like chemotaxis protein
MVGGLSGTTVLVVDNDVDSLDIVELVIAEQGGTVRSATSGREVLEVLQTWRPDLILLDLSMPEMDGYDLLAAIRLEPALRSIPAVALTGHGYARDKQRCEEAGFVRHITKPLDIETLLSVIAALVPANKLAAVQA